ncbi:MAG: hypothetical protein GVY22_09270 [Gammaproteobacteria bacterium]|jgi:polyferredoxin|nr:hypothetical protein [Gammaproteobacteria bacterium]
MPLNRDHLFAFLVFLVFMAFILLTALHAKAGTVILEMPDGSIVNVTDVEDVFVNEDGQHVIRFDDGYQVKADGLAYFFAPDASLDAVLSQQD